MIRISSIVYSFFIVSTISCKITQNDTQIELVENTQYQINDSTDLDFGDFILRIEGDSKLLEDFEIKQNFDTIFLIKKMYLGIENIQFQLVSNKIKEKISINQTLKIGYLQSTIDDNPSSDLGIYFNNTKTVDILKVDFDDVFNKITRDNFEKIKTTSVNHQKFFYSNLIHNREQYKECCPEYINQVKDFLSKKDYDFSNVSSLNISPYVNELTWDFNYKINNVSKKKVFAYKSNEVSSFSESSNDFENIIDKKYLGTFSVNIKTEETTSGMASILYEFSITNNDVELKTNTFHESISCNGKYKAVENNNNNNNILELYFVGSEKGCNNYNPMYYLKEENGEIYARGLGGEASFYEWIKLNKID